MSRNEIFWQRLDALLERCEIVIDRPKGSRHPRFHEIVYKLDYGYLAGTSSNDGEGIDVWLGSDAAKMLDAVMKAYSTTPPTGEGYIKSMAYDKLEMFPTETGGSASTYMCDYFWNNSGATSGFRLVLRGCNAHFGSLSGTSDVNVSYAVSGSSVNVGAPLCEAVEEWTVEPEYAEVA